MAKLISLWVGVMFFASQLLADIINKLRSRSNVRDSRVNAAGWHGFMVSDRSEEC
jgi:hypothetical protein